MDIVDVLKIVIPSLLGIAGLITALANRKMPQNDEKRVSNESFLAQISASKSLSESSKELVGISQNLIAIIEKEMKELMDKNKELQEQMEEIKTQALECKEGIETLRQEYNRVLHICRQLVNGIGVLLAQMSALGTEPQWTPPQEVIDTIEHRRILK